MNLKMLGKDDKRRPLMKKIYQRPRGPPRDAHFLKLKEVAEGTRPRALGAGSRVGLPLDSGERGLEGLPFVPPFVPGLQSPGAPNACAIARRKGLLGDFHGLPLVRRRGRQCEGSRDAVMVNVAMLILLIV